MEKVLSEKYSRGPSLYGVLNGQGFVLCCLPASTITPTYWDLRGMFLDQMFAYAFTKGTAAAPNHSIARITLSALCITS